MLSKSSASTKNQTKQNRIFVAESHAEGTALCSEKFQAGDSEVRISTKRQLT